MASLPGNSWRPGPRTGGRDGHPAKPRPALHIAEAVASAPVIDRSEVRRVPSGLKDDAWCKFGALDGKRPAPPPRSRAARAASRRPPPERAERADQRCASSWVSCAPALSPSSSRAQGRTRRGPARCSVSRAAAAGCGPRRSRPREPPTSIAHDRVLADLRGGGGSDGRRCDGVGASRAPVVMGAALDDVDGRAARAQPGVRALELPLVRRQPGRHHGWWIEAVASEP
jgi:hypothetical protein